MARKLPEMISRFDFPPPTSWDDFQNLCKDLWSREFGIAETSHYGRQGHAQQGVDIYLRAPNSRKKWWGIQCKKKQRWPSSKLNLKEIQDEADAAITFTPKISHLIIATTARRSAKLQREVRVLSTRFLKKYKFSIYVSFWDDILDLLAKHPEIQAHYFGSIMPRPQPANRRDFIQSLINDQYWYDDHLSPSEHRLECRSADITISLTHDKMTLRFLQQDRTHPLPQSTTAPFFLFTSKILKPVFDLYQSTPLTSFTASIDRSGETVFRVNTQVTQSQSTYFFTKDGVFKNLGSRSEKASKDEDNALTHFRAEMWNIHTYLYPHLC